MGLRILISGAGIAGPCLAYWLRHHGFEPTLVERAPELRTGGYIIDFWGAGFDIAERMGLRSKVLEEGYKVREVRQVDPGGKRVSGFQVSVLNRITQGRYTSLPRSALARCLYESLANRVETLFDESIVGLEDTGHEVRVRFQRMPPRTFDLVVGADGLHSPVRRLVFGEELRFERFLGIKVAAFEVGGYRPRDELVYVIRREVGGQVGRFTMRDDRTMFLFIFTSEDPEIPEGFEQQKAVLRDRFSNSGWECPAILQALERADNLYIDRVSQIRMDRWSQGRVALVGDAAFCASLLAGQGSALAMIAAYILAGELKRAEGNHEAAFAKYHERLGGFIRAKQKGAIRLSSFFAPHSRLDIFVGDQIMKLTNVPFVTEKIVAPSLQDKIELCDY